MSKDKTRNVSSWSRWILTVACRSRPTFSEVVFNNINQSSVICVSQLVRPTDRTGLSEAGLTRVGPLT